MASWLSIIHGSVPALPAHCEATTAYLALLSRITGACIPTPLALLSSTLGCLSIASWLFAQIPQILKNYHLQSTSGLSVYFLIEWCLGDTTNLLGCLLTRQAEWQVVVAAYYVCVDVVLVWQYIWYTHLKARARRRHGKRHDFVGSEDDEEGEMVPTSSERIHAIEASPAVQHRNRSHKETDENDILTAHESKAMTVPVSQRATFSRDRPNPLVPSPRTLMMMSLIIAVASAHPSTLSDSNPPLGPTTPPSRLDILGSFFSWSSTLLYLGSRLPQIYKNHTRQSTSGLSAELFIAAFFGNLFYSSSILTNPLAWADFGPYGGHGWAGPAGSNRSEWIARATPFWLGAAGVLVLDATVGIQFLMFSETNPGSENPIVIIVEDDRGRRRWTTVTGWMRGWMPRISSLSSRRSSSDECENLLGGSRATERHRRDAYGSV